MNEIVNVQLLLFIQAIQIGIIMGIIYDLIRIARKAVKHPNWIVQVEDGLYWAISLIVSFGILYNHNYVNIRLFVIAGIILGALLYFSTASLLFMSIATWIINLIHQAIHYVIRCLMIPLNWCFKVLRIPVNYLCLKMKLLNQYQKQTLRKGKRYTYYVQADMRATIKNRKNKSIYKTKKTD